MDIPVTDHGNAGTQPIHPVVFILVAPDVPIDGFIVKDDEDRACDGRAPEIEVLRLEAAWSGPDGCLVLEEVLELEGRFGALIGRGCFLCRKRCRDHRSQEQDNDDPEYFYLCIPCHSGS